MSFFSNMKNGRYYSKYLNKNINPMNKMVAYKNYYYMTTLTSFLLGRKLNLISSNNFLIVGGSDATSSDLSAISSTVLKEAVQSLLSFRCGLTQLSMFQLLNLNIQWNGLDLQSIGKLSSVTARVSRIL